MDRRASITTQQTVNMREHSLDIMRGIAVIVMIIAHCIAFFKSGTNEALESIMKFGDAIAFVVFLTVFSGVFFIYYRHKRSDWGRTKPKMLKRIIQLILAYYLCAFVSYLGHYNFSDNTWIKEVISILGFTLTPGYTEFIVSFIIFNSLFLLFPDLFFRFGRKLSLGITIGIILYILGYIFYFHSFGQPIDSYKYLLVGAKDMLRFPILQYSIVVMVGLSLGNLLTSGININKKRAFLFLGFIITTLLVLIGYLIQPYQKLTIFNDFERWPPTIPFMAVGLSFTFIILTLIIKKANSQTKSYFLIFLEKIGQHSLFYFITHIIILQLFDRIIKYRSDSVVVVTFLTILTFIATLLIKKALTRSGKNELKQDEKKQPKRRNPLVSVLLILIIVSIILSTNFVKGAIPDMVYFTKRENDASGDILIKKEFESVWWNYDYEYQRRINISNMSAFQNVDTNSWLEVDINHKDLVSQGKSQVSGNDLMVIYLDGETFVNVNFIVKNPNTENAKIAIKLVRPLDKNSKDRNYFVYYGNKLAAAKAPVNQGELKDNLKGIIASERINSLSLDLDRIWTLKDENFANNSSLELTLRVNSTPFVSIQNVLYSYQILGTNISGTLSKKSATEMNSKLNIGNLKPGIYQIQAKASAIGKEVLSTKKTFIVSYPLYVAWTMDWEGYDVNDKYLQRMDDIANTYKIPISHFFNPRIYLSVNKDRAESLTNWVKQREKNRGDSIGLHLHFFYDMVQASGVDPYNTGGTDFEGNPITSQKRPIWDNGGANDGYDIPASSFSYSELNKILEWSLARFAENSLSFPKGFRSGGWFLDLDNLHSIEDSGFLYDSSGRQAYTWGRNKLKGEWNLQPTTQPYKPSLSDQNLPTDPTFNIWEFPNNGADSYTFTAEQMISKFNANLGNSILNDKKIVTYLSHPHWFNIDDPKLVELYNFISNFTYSNDKGPVKFITLDEAHKVWAK